MEDNRPVYRLVNGQKVRIAGDIRDPKRRYSLVIDEFGGHYLEFTEEQESQRDLEAAQWEAERPQREDLVKQQEEQWEAFKGSLKYEDHIIAYLDVLGWKDAIARSAEDENLVRRLGISSKRSLGKKELAKICGVGLDHFSDSIVISRKVSSSFSNDLRELLWLVRYVITDYLEEGFTIRGAIVRGDLVHQDNLIYGPALVKAIELEQKEALWPRVILDSDLADIKPKGIREDKDGWLFLEYLDVIIGGFSRYLNVETLHTCKSVVQKGLREYKQKSNIYSKYLWLANYFNDVLTESPHVTIEPLQLSI